MGFKSFGSILDVRSVFLQQDISILFADTIGRRDIILSGFKPVDDLFGGIISSLFTFGIKFSHDLVQTKDADLGIIGKFQHAPANYRLRGDSPISSPFLVILWNALGML